MMSSTAAADFSFRTTSTGEEEDLGATKLSSGGFQRASSSSPEKRRNRTPNEFEEDEKGQNDERTATEAGVNHDENYLNWGFSQVFGERAPNEEVQDADIISAVEFDRTGDWLALVGGALVFCDA